MARNEIVEGASRRLFLRRSGVLAGVAAGAAALLSACQLSAPGSSPAASSSGAAPTAAGGTAAPAAGGAISGSTGAAQVSAGGKLEQVLKRGKIIVGTGSTNPPWHFEDEKGALVGMDIEIAKMFSKGLFDKTDAIDFVKQQADARIPNLQTDKVDVVIQFMTVTPLRAQNVEFTIPYYREAVNLLLPANSPYNGAKDMAGKNVKISILQNVTAEAMVRRGVAGAQVMQLDSQASCILALDAGRVDAAAVDDSTCRWLFAQNPTKYKVGNQAWDSQTYSAAVRPGDPRWLNWLNTALHEAMVGLDWPTYAAAFKTYFGASLEEPPSGFPVEFGVRGLKTA
jgi:polar amino acid transport system substrate-binding protein